MNTSTMEKTDYTLCISFSGYYVGIETIQLNADRRIEVELYRVKGEEWGCYAFLHRGHPYFSWYHYNQDSGQWRFKCCSINRYFEPWVKKKEVTP